MLLTKFPTALIAPAMAFAVKSAKTISERLNASDRLAVFFSASFTSLEKSLVLSPASSVATVNFSTAPVAFLKLLDAFFVSFPTVSKFFETFSAEDRTFSIDSSYCPVSTESFT